MSVLNSRIKVLPLALAGGLTWGFAAATLAVWVMVTGHGTVVVDFLGELYPYYDSTIAGVFWGILWGFVDVFLGLFIFGLLYNLFAGKPREI